jgi:hypothetical protein
MPKGRTSLRRFVKHLTTTEHQFLKDNKDIMRGEATAKFILSLGARCSILVSFTPRLIYSTVRKFRCPLKGMLRGPWQPTLEKRSIFLTGKRNITPPKSKLLRSHHTVCVIPVADGRLIFKPQEVYISAYRCNTNQWNRKRRTRLYGNYKCLSVTQNAETVACRWSSNDFSGNFLRQRCMITRKLCSPNYSCEFQQSGPN